MTAMRLSLPWKEDTRPPRAGWAPGDYCCHCLTCGAQFIGAKRAWDCADCAYDLKRIVFTELAAAVQNGFFFANWSAEEIAEDLLKCCSAVEDKELAELIPHVEEWKKTRGQV